MLAPFYVFLHECLKYPLLIANNNILLLSTTNAVTGWVGHLNVRHLVVACLHATMPHSHLLLSATSPLCLAQLLVILQPPLASLQLFLAQVQVCCKSTGLKILLLNNIKE